MPGSRDSPDDGATVIRRSGTVEAVPGMDAVETVPLPPAVSEFVSRYEERVGGRDEFLWKWIHHLFPAFELSSVAEAERDSVRVAKTVLTIFVTVLDDLVEERGDLETFEEARFVPFDATRIRHDRDGVDGDVVGYLTDSGWSWRADSVTRCGTTSSRTCSATTCDRRSTRYGTGTR